jgi:hypothetical protein
MAAVGTLCRHAGRARPEWLEFVLFFWPRSWRRAAVPGGSRWAAIGAAAVKIYRAVFRPGVLIWLVVVPKLRRWLISLAYLGGVVTLASLRDRFSGMPITTGSPHQAARPRPDQFQARLHRQLIPTQIAFATPPVWILGAWGFMRCSCATPARWPRAC